MTEDRLDRLEDKIDRLTEKVEQINVAIGEIRGSRRAFYAMASLLGAIAGAVGAFFAGGWKRP